MDIRDLFERLHYLTGRFPDLSKEQLTELRELGTNLHAECDSILNEWGCSLDSKNELKRGKDIHEWFELTYAQYLTVPRSVLQSMPIIWQEKFVGLLEELDDTQWLSLLPKDSCYRVELRQTKDSLNGRGWKWGSKVSDPLADYQRGRRNVFAE